VRGHGTQQAVHTAACQQWGCGGEQRPHRAGRRSVNGKSRHKSDPGPLEIIVRDPEDGVTIRTPKALVSTRAALPKSQMHGVMSTQLEDSSTMATSEIGEAFLEQLPSMSTMSSMSGSVTASDMAEEVEDFSVEAHVVRTGSSGMRRPCARPATSQCSPAGAAGAAGQGDPRPGR